MVMMILSVRYGIYETTNSCWKGKVKVGLERNGVSDRVKEVCNRSEEVRGAGEWRLFPSTRCPVQ